jgi:hypothetical protein
LPKGLISWLFGNQYPLGRSPSGFCSEIHQITPHVQRIGVVSYPVQLGSFPLGLCRVLRNSYYRARPEGSHLPLSSLVTRFRTSHAARLEFLRCYLGNLNDTRAKTIGRSESPRYVFTEVVPDRVKVASKPSDEGSLGRPRNLTDHPVKWNSQRCFKVHPYWTTNLKYVY